MDIDAVIIDLEFQLETIHNPYGHFVNFRFIDVTPNKTKLNKMKYTIALLLAVVGGLVWA